MSGNPPRVNRIGFSAAEKRKLLSTNEVSTNELNPATRAAPWAENRSRALGELVLSRSGPSGNLKRGGIKVSIRVASGFERTTLAGEHAEQDAPA